MTIPGSRRPTHGPTLSKYLDRGAASTSTPKLAHRAHTAVTGAFLWSSGSPPGVGAGCARKCARLPLAASYLPELYGVKPFSLITAQTPNRDIH